MKHMLRRAFLPLLAGALLVPALSAQYTAGYIALNPSGTDTAEFDIVNETGPNASTLPDSTFPIATTLNFLSLSLTVDYLGGGSRVFGSSYFTVDPVDGISFDGAALSELTGNASGGLLDATSATLTGDFSSTAITLTDGTTATIKPGFSATITDSSGMLLFDGSDFALIDTTAGGSTTPVVPEPSTWMLLGTGMLGLLGRIRARARRLLESVRLRPAFTALGALGCFLIVASAHATPVGDPVKLNVATAPSSGLAGSSTVTVTGSGFPSGTITPAEVTISIAPTCGAAGTAATAISVLKVVGTSEKVEFVLPASLSTGNFYVSIKGTSSGGTAFYSTDCSEVQVTNSTPVLASCVPTSSLAITVGTNVNAYVPFGSWDGSGGTGIEEVPLEGTGTARNFPTGTQVNSCAANSVTGEVVCTENNTNVDLINGTTFASISSGSNSFASFSGGDCENCGVAINPTSNTAVIGMGLSGLSGSGVQVLNLTSNTFNTAFPMSSYVSEDISVDSGRNLILSPGEGGGYDLLKIGTSNALSEYTNNVGGELDSAAEDCTTGIALAAYEFSDEIYITDLTQASFTAGSPGSWTAPGQFINLGDSGYSAGTCGLSSAPGTNHLAVVTGEFGGQAYAALKLPSTSGSGTPTLADYAYVGIMPALPTGGTFSAGYDPHTITAYTSPNTGKSYAVLVDWSSGQPDYLAVVDLACVLTQPRSGTHIVSGTASACTKYIAIP